MWFRKTMLWGLDSELSLKVFVIFQSCQRRSPRSQLSLHWLPQGLSIHRWASLQLHRSAPNRSALPKSTLPFNSILSGDPCLAVLRAYYWFCLGSLLEVVQETDNMGCWEMNPCWPCEKQVSLWAKDFVFLICFVSGWKCSNSLSILQTFLKMAVLT